MAQKEWLVDVAHEIAGLEAAWEAIDSGNPFGWTAWYSHARALHEFYFFETNPQYPADLRANQFVLSWTHGLHDDTVRMLNRLWNDAGCLVAHLSGRRAELRTELRAQGEKEVPDVRIQHFLTDLNDRFLENLNSDAPDLREALEAELNKQRTRYYPWAHYVA